MNNMNTLKKQFYQVMYKYQKPFTEKGVMASLDVWKRNKKGLRELLSKHPDWNERELAVVFRFPEVREIEPTNVDEAVFEMEELAVQSGLEGERLSNFKAALKAATADYKQVPDASQLPIIREHGGIDCAPGQKASRIINRLCRKFGLDQFQTEVRATGEFGVVTTRKSVPYNAAFARLSDTLNPGTVLKTGVLSIHPCDYLEMSNRDNSWTSCHCLEEGGYQAGCLSYMGDEVSMVFFTVSETVTADFHKQPRITREIFCYADGTLMQSRLYPSDSANQRELYFDLVQKAISSCLDQPGRWVMRELSDGAFWRSVNPSFHYKDYDYGYAKVSQLEDAANTIFTIGSRTRCVCCGEPLRDTEDVRCGSCCAKVICNDCGAEIDFYYANYVEEDGVSAYYCHACRPRCDICGNYMKEALLTIHSSGDHRQRHVCPACYDEAIKTCQECGVKSACFALLASKFCRRAEWLPDAA